MGSIFQSSLMQIKIQGHYLKYVRGFARVLKGFKLCVCEWEGAKYISSVDTQNFNLGV
jgi:hypothetical protein